MFKNIFKQNGEPATAATSDAVPPDAQAQPESEISGDESRVWREKIVAAGPDDAALLRLAHDAPGVDLKLAAIEALTQEDSFKQAMREFRDHDKRLHRAAKSRWLAARAGRKTAAEADALIANARDLLGQEVIPVNRVVELDHAWAALDAGLLDDAVAAEYAALSGELATKVRARGEGEQAITRWLTAVEEAIAHLRAPLSGVAQGDIPPGESQALAVRLQELLSGIPDATDVRCIEKTDTANRALAVASSVVARAEFLQALPAPGVADEENEKLKIEQWRSFPELSEAELHSVLAHRFAGWRNARLHERQLEQDAHRAHEREQRAQQNKQRLTALERDVEAAEAAHAAGQVTELTRLLTAIDHALKSGPLNAALARRIESLRREQLRLRDWQRWSGRQRHEELVAEAKALADAAGGKVVVKNHAEAIASLRQRWKDLDKLTGGTNQTLWLAFDGALKTAYAPVAAHLDKLKLAREENLAARNQIVDGLVQAAAKYFPPVQEGAASAPGTKPDWRAVDRTLEEAQIAWRKLGPVEHTVPRKAQQGDNAVTARYLAARQTLQTPLKEAYREATQHREQLIAAAKKLVGPVATARDTIDQVRGLQAQWQTSAKALPLPRREENALWTEFKTTIDAIFAERNAARAAKEAEFSARSQAREDVIERLVACSSGSSASEIKRAMSEAETAWRAAPELPKPQRAKFDVRYRAARDAATRRLGEIAAYASQARFDALITAMALCQEREASGEHAADLEARWNSVEHLPDAWKTKLEARFRGDGLQADPQSSSSSVADSSTSSGKNLGEVLLNLEVAADIESPAEFLGDRQQLKLRALKDAMESRRPAVTTPQEIERWLLVAAATPRLDGMSRERLEKIIAALRVRQRRQPQGRQRSP